MDSEIQFLDELPLGAYWEAQLADLPFEESIEFILYGRVWVTGQDGRFGPYLAINAMADLAPQLPNGPQPAIIVRADFHSLGGTAGDRHLRRSEKFETDGYHGGSLLDEVAALVSLIFGTRIKAGQIIRRFDGSDSRGRPQFWTGLRPPYLPERTDSP